jgi:hypothetical protein
MQKQTPAHEYINKLIEDEMRAIYRKVYGAGFFWGFVTALTGAIAFYLTTGA